MDSEIIQLSVSSAETVEQSEFDVKKYNTNQLKDLGNQITSKFNEHDCPEEIRVAYADLARAKSPKPTNCINQLLQKQYESEYNQPHRYTKVQTSSIHTNQTVSHSPNETCAKEEAVVVEPVHKKEFALKGLLGVSTPLSAVKHDSTNKDATNRIGALLKIKSITTPLESGTNNSASTAAASVTPVSSQSKAGESRQPLRNTSTDSSTYLKRPPGFTDHNSQNNTNSNTNTNNKSGNSSNSNRDSHANASNQNSDDMKGKWNETRQGQSQREIFEKERQAILAGRGGGGVSATAAVSTDGTASSGTEPQSVSATAASGVTAVKKGSYHDECDDLMMELMNSSNQANGTGINQPSKQKSVTQPVSVLVPDSPEHAASPRDRGGGLLMGDGPGGSLLLSDATTYPPSEASPSNNYRRSLTAKEVMQRSHRDDTYAHFSSNSSTHSANSDPRSYLENIDLSSLLAPNQSSATASAVVGLGHSGGVFPTVSSSSSIFSTSSSGLSLCSMGVNATASVGAISVSLPSAGSAANVWGAPALVSSLTAVPAGSALNTATAYPNEPPNLWASSSSSNYFLSQQQQQQQQLNSNSGNSNINMDPFSASLNGHHSVHSHSAASFAPSSLALHTQEEDAAVMPLVSEMLRFGDFGIDVNEDSAATTAAGAAVTHSHSQPAAKLTGGGYSSTGNNSYSGGGGSSSSISSSHKKIDVKSLFSSAAAASTLSPGDEWSPTAGSARAGVSTSAGVGHSSSFSFNTPTPSLRVSGGSSTSSVHDGSLHLSSEGIRYHDQSPATATAVTPTITGNSNSSSINNKAMSGNTNGGGGGGGKSSSGVKMSAASRLQLQRLKALTGSGTATIIAPVQVPTPPTLVTPDKTKTSTTAINSSSATAVTATATVPVKSVTTSRSSALTSASAVKSNLIQPVKLETCLGATTTQSQSQSQQSVATVPAASTTTSASVSAAVTVKSDGTPTTTPRMRKIDVKTLF